MQRAPLVLLFCSLGAVQCGAEDRDLPTEWQEARSLPLDQSAACTGDSGLTGRLALMRDMGRLRATYEHAQFRCNQRVCAYLAEDGAGGARVLVQPCDMEPSTVSKCSCAYTIGFDIPGVEPGRRVELSHRWDRYGATTEPQPELIASVRAP